jgi:hypothetical protein
MLSPCDVSLKPIGLFMAAKTPGCGAAFPLLSDLRKSATQP